MFMLALHKHHVTRMAIFGIAIVVLNLLTLRYLVADDIDNMDLSLLAGHTVIVDPGHGGIDAGASGNGIIEKNVNLAVSDKLAEVLRSNGVTVTMTREGDIDYYTRGKGGKRNDLLKRVDIVNQSGAELFVSIHVNAMKGNWSGAQVFFGTNSPDSKTLAETIQRALYSCPPGNKRQAKQDSKIIVLNGPSIPGVLVEIGFLTNRQEAGMLIDPNYQQKLATQIAKALAYHFSHNVGR
jgi:N-acetylmuramoyl-L-alanine amidase